MAPSLMVEFINFLQNLWHFILHVPIWIVLLKARNIAHPPDVVAAPVLLHVARFEWLAGDLLADRNGFEHRAVAVAPTTHVVDFSAAWLFVEFVEGAN